MLSTVAIAAVMAMAPAAEARSRLGRFKFPSGYKAPTNGGYQYKHDTQVSKVQCTAKATAKNFKKSVDAHVSAVTAAWEYACNSEPTYDWDYAIYQKWKHAVKKYDAGLAYAKAIATADTECKSKGNAWGCAAAYAYSEAWAKATVSAHASAWSEAIAKCKCDGKFQEAAAYTDGYANELKHLNARVKAYAESSICVDGDDYDHGYDAQTCVQDIYATVFAKSVSIAALEGNCVSKDYYRWGTEKEYGEFKAKAIALAKAEIDVYEIKGCVPYLDAYNPYH